MGIDPQHAPQLWRRLGSDYNEIFVRPIIRERIRMVVANDTGRFGVNIDFTQGPHWEQELLRRQTPGVRQRPN